MSGHCALTMSHPVLFKMRTRCERMVLSSVFACSENGWAISLPPSPFYPPKNYPLIGTLKSLPLQGRIIPLLTGGIRDLGAEGSEGGGTFQYALLLLSERCPLLLAVPRESRFPSA